MNVLFISALLPYPLLSGGQVRMFNLLRALSQRHKITLLSFIREKEEMAYLKELSFLTKVETIYRGRAKTFPYIFRAVTGKFSWLHTTYDNQEMRDRISSHISTGIFDLLHLEPGYVFPSVPDSAVPTVVAEHNVEHLIYEGYMRRYPYPILKSLINRDIKKMIATEKKTWNNASQIIAVSDSDAQIIAHESKKKITVVPNGVDTDAFLYLPKKKIKENFEALFVGDFRWIQNRDAVLYLSSVIWPEIYRKFPEATLKIVGRELSRDILSNLPFGVRYIERVENIIEAYHSADFLIAPLRVGGGTKYKILEAMASGLPVITTEKGMEGLIPEAKKTVWMANTKNQWITIIETLLSDPKATEVNLKSARNIIENHYSWKRIAQIQDSVWKDAYAGKKD